MTTLHTPADLQLYFPSEDSCRQHAKEASNVLKAAKNKAAVFVPSMLTSLMGICSAVLVFFCIAKKKTRKGSKTHRIENECSKVQTYNLVMSVLLLLPSHDLTSRQRREEQAIQLSSC